MRLRESVLAQAPFEFAKSASQSQRTLDRHLALQISAQEVLKTVDLRRPGNLQVDSFLNKWMLKPVLDLGTVPDAFRTPNIFYPFQTFS